MNENLKRESCKHERTQDLGVEPQIVVCLNCGKVVG